MISCGWLIPDVVIPSNPTATIIQARPRSIIMSEEAKAEATTAASSLSDQPSVFIGDPEDKAIIRSLARRNMLAYLFMAVSFVGNFVQYMRQPTLITAVVSEDGRRVVKINDRDYGKTDAVMVSPDRPNDLEKVYLVRTFTDYLFGIDPVARKYQLEHAHSLLVSDFAAKYFNDYKASGLLDKQRDERWQAKWETQKVEIDRRDPYLVHVIGTQDITKYLGEKTEREVVQHSLDFKLVDDSPRSARNMLSSFLIARFGGSELSRTHPTSTETSTQLP